MAAGKVVKGKDEPTIADSIGGQLESGSITVKECQAVIDEKVFVSEEDIMKSMRLLAEYERHMVCGASAVSLAGFLKIRE